MLALVCIFLYRLDTVRPDLKEYHFVEEMQELQPPRHKTNSMFSSICRHYTIINCLIIIIQFL